MDPINAKRVIAINDYFGCRVEHATRTALLLSLPKSDMNEKVGPLSFNITSTNPNSPHGRPRAHGLGRPSGALLGGIAIRTKHLL
jgi:hypothetical protein